MKQEEFEKRAEMQGGYDREFNEWKIIDIHQIPDLLEFHHEIDFYCCNGEKVYLLRIRNRVVEKYDFVYPKEDKEKGYPPYLIAELPVHKITNELLKTVLDKFELYKMDFFKYI